MCLKWNNKKNGYYALFVVTRHKIRADTVLKYFPLFCPKCKKESLIEVEELKIKIISEPSTKTQSQ